MSSSAVASAATSASAWAALAAAASKGGESEALLSAEALIALETAATAELPAHAREANVISGWSLAHEAAWNGSVFQLRLLEQFAETRPMLWQVALCEEEEAEAPRQPRAWARRAFPARIAGFAGHVDVLRYFAEHTDSRVNETLMESRCFRLVAMDAAMEGHVEAVSYLAERGREHRRHPFWCSGYGPRGQSLPLVAILRGCTLEMVRLLVETGTLEQQGMLMGALFRLKSEKDRDSFYGAALSENGYGEKGLLVLELLDRLAPLLGITGDGDGQPDHWDLRGGSDWVLVRAVREGHASIVQAFLAALRPKLARNIFASMLKDAELNLSGNIIHLAAARGRREIIHLLAAHDSVIDAKALFQESCHDGESPAELAHRNGHEALALFLETAADVNLGPRVALEKYDAGWRERMLSVARLASFQLGIRCTEDGSFCAASADHTCHSSSACSTPRACAFAC
eukprot:TRINITY_DN32703_c0_g1_i1.p1 TRINITY_DN32703_c0_g1~~TRINITY_DN32703_c0_g1_i1.p1  ORF type:complete len:488 (-),score=83.43 TRINITY_DN32703_c0_g1_i1:290-1666(-)